MRFEIAVHAQGGRVRSDLAQKAMLDEETEVVVNGGQRNVRDAFADCRVDLLRGSVAVGGNDRFVDYLTLMRGGEAMLPGEVPEFCVRETHNY